MRRERFGWPSPAMAVAVVALVSSFAGPAVADQAVDLAHKAKLLNGKTIKKRTVAGDRLKLNAVTGAEVDESKLTKVPSATRADSAGTATSAANAANAANADTLDSLDSTAFVKSGASAGGDLAGSYPNPTIAAGAVTPAKTGTVPAARVTRTSAQSVANLASVAVPFNTQYFDTQELHDNLASPTRLTAPITGLYQVSAGVKWDANATGYRYMAIEQSGTAVAVDQRDAVGGGGFTQQSASVLVRLTADDFVTVNTTQTSGGSLNILSSDGSPFLSMVWVGPA